MSEQDLPQPVLTGEGDKEVPAVLAAVEERLAKSNSPQEIILWTQVSGEIQRQGESLKRQEHRRNLERKRVRFKMSLAIGAVVIGTGLVASFSGVGLFVLGSGLY